ncbi:MAG: DUF4493 domain-containing protein [Rikenellaceae bacterium]
MKTNLRRAITLAASAALLLTVASGCDGSDSVFNTPDNTINPDEVIDPYSSGYISFSSLIISVEEEDENFFDNESDSYEQSRSSSSDGVNIDDYIVTLTNETSGEVVYQKTYAEVKAEEGMLTLPADYYILYITSDLEIPAVAWNQKIYASSEKRLLVGDENITTVGSVACRLATIKNQVSIAADMLALFNTADDAETPFTVTLQYGDASLVFDVDKLYSSSATDEENEANAGYFAPQDGVSEIVTTLSGMYNTAADNEEANYIPITWSQSISDVSSGQLRMISIKIDNYNEGNIQITFEVEGWVYDTTLGVDILSGSFITDLEEGLVVDPDSEKTDVGAPVLALDNNLSLDEAYIISSDNIDTDSDTYTPIYKATITPSDNSTVDNIAVTISSTNSSLIAALAESGYTDNKINIWDGDMLSTDMSDYITLYEDASTGAISITLKYRAINALYNYAGTHTIKVEATDSKSRRSYTNLLFEVQSAPEIVWDGGEFGQYYEISTDEVLNVVLKISSMSGLESLRIKFTSPLLTPEFLEAINLAEEIDLANTTTKDMADMLTELELPIDDDVKGKTYLEVDISEFMPILADLPYTESAAYTDFEITAVDSYGESVETLQVVRYYSDEEIAANKN